MMVSLDGYTESKDPTEYWHNWDDEMANYMMDFFGTVDTFIYGRKSYQDMIAYWPTLNDDFGKIMNETPKLVFSKTLEKMEWNAQLIKQDPVDFLSAMKSKGGKDMVLFAGPNLAAPLIKNNIIDEYRLIVNPVLLSGNKPLFPKMERPQQLVLTQTTPFKCGNVLLIYSALRN